jgi:DNA-binding transcriptional MerR regulator
VFREKEYQVKDIMEMYDISRDTIKYYETHGLICSKRKENGYRVFDEMNVRKLKKILALRDMGLTVEEALLHCQSESIEKRTEIMTKVRLRTEEEIRELNRRLQRIREFERNTSENIRYTSGFNVGGPVTFCVDCPHFDSKTRRSFTIMSALQVECSREKGIENMKECEILRDGSLMQPFCLNCTKQEKYDLHYRYRIPYENDEQLRNILFQAYADLEMQGHIPSPKLYMSRKVIKNNGADVLILDTFWPVLNKENNLT